MLIKTVWLYNELILQCTLTLNVRSISSGMCDVFGDESKNITCVMGSYHDQFSAKSGILYIIINVCNG